MKSNIQLPSGSFSVDLNKPLDISLQLQGNESNPRAWYLGQPKIEPVKDGDWIAKVSEGASINFNTIEFNPHAHGTHTECFGHISIEFHSINKSLKHFFFKAKVISLRPEKYGEDLVFSKESLQRKLQKDEAEALIIRTLPNEEAKTSKNYDHTNWPYLKEETAKFIRKCNVEHLLIDLPSIDREDGDVLAHRVFWNYPENPRKHATITEFIFVSDEIKDGYYLLNLQVAPFENDAAPSRPVLFEIEE